MPSISVNVPQTDSLLSYEIDLSLTVGNLKEFVNAETGLDTGKQILLLNGQPMSNNDLSLESAGVKDGDILEARLVSANRTASQPQAGPSRGEDAAIEGQIEQQRQQILGNPQARAQLQQQAPQVADALDDPVRFRQAFRQLMSQQQTEREALDAELAALDDDPTPENQARIAEIIRMKKIDEQREQAYEENPEFFARVTMLYVNVEVNGNPVKAFVDSGAQVTIMSPKCAEDCKVTNLIDQRYGGIARGVGTAKILGRIHRADVKIGDAELPCSFTVMEGKGVDMLFGLDMLKRYQACIDLGQNRLIFQHGVSVPFLGESEIPTDEVEFENEATVIGPDGTAVGTKTGAPHPSASDAGSAGASKGATQPGNFSGQGRTLGGPSSSAAAGSQTSQPTSKQQAATTNRPKGTASYPQSDIDTLVRIGATPEQAVEALRACDGDVEYAANLLFQQLF